jgi:flavin-binding protein dodecin
MQIDCNEQFEKHESSIRVSRDSFSNVIDSSVNQAKHNFGRISTFRGMQIDCNEQFEKHETSIRVSRDSFSNVIDSNFDSAKQDFEKISTFRAMQMRFLWLRALPSAEE